MYASSTIAHAQSVANRCLTASSGTPLFDNKGQFLSDQVTWQMDKLSARTNSILAERYKFFNDALREFCLVHIFCFESMLGLNTLKSKGNVNCPTMPGIDRNNAVLTCYQCTADLHNRCFFSTVSITNVMACPFCCGASKRRFRDPVTDQGDSVKQWCKTWSFGKSTAFLQL